MPCPADWINITAHHIFVIIILLTPAIMGGEWASKLGATLDHILLLEMSVWQSWQVASKCQFLSVTVEYMKVVSLHWTVMAIYNLYIKDSLCPKNYPFINPYIHLSILPSNQLNNQTAYSPSKIIHPTCQSLSPSN